jgi:hypothetical protein
VRGVERPIVVAIRRDRPVDLPGDGPRLYVWRALMREA